MHPAFRRTDHRPWPLPMGRWKWRQSWSDLLFAHWPVSADIIRPYVPESLEIQEFDGTSWIGVVPFYMSGVMRRPWPDLPYISAFAELNVRVYVTRDGKPGVWFFSLDATNPLAVWAARRFFNLPYFHADIHLTVSANTTQYVSRRKRTAAEAEFQAQYRPVSPIFEAQAGSLDHWLTERYCLYSVSAQGALYRCEVHHLPWPLQKAEADIEVNTVCTATTSIELSRHPEVLHYAKHIDVVVWSPERIG